MSEDSNVKLGNKTLKKNVNLGNNTGLGNESLVENKEGFQNTSIGAFNLNNNEDGYNNSAVGYKALKNSKNNNNSALGARSGETLVNGKSNVLIGKEADVSKKNAKNQIVIGANAKGSEDNSVTLGNSEVTKVNMSESKNAELNCGQVNVYNLEGKKSYSLPNSDGKKNQLLKTDGKGNLRWTNDSKGSGSGSTSISNNPPTASDRSGNAGDLRYDDNYLYLALGNNNWAKTALTTVNYGWTQLGTDIDGEAAGDYSGISVSLSSDGSRVAIGAYLNDGNGSESGHVRIYDWNGSTWVQVGNDIDGEAAGDQSGYSVSLSANGTRVAIGSIYNGSTNGGHVRIYEYNSSTSAWVQLGTDIDGEAAGDRFGSSVSLSTDGSRVAIGARYNDGSGNSSGHVRIYDWSGSSWDQVGSDIDGEAANDSSGWTVSLSSEGSKVAIGSWANGNSSGHVRIYEYREYTSSDADTYHHTSREQGTTNTKPLIITASTSTAPVVGTSYWTQVGSDIDGEAFNDLSGYSVSLSANGSRVAIGAILNTNINGAVSGHTRIYEYSSGSWTQLGDDIDGEEALDFSGRTVSLSADGSRVAIGADGNDGNGTNSGQTRIYEYSSGSWTQLGDDIDGEAADDGSGRSVSLSSDGLRVAIGANLNDDNGNSSGHVRIYELKFE